MLLIIIRNQSNPTPVQSVTCHPSTLPPIPLRNDEHGWRRYCLILLLSEACLTVPPMFLFSIKQLSQTVNYPGAGRPGVFAGCDNDMLCWAQNEEGRPTGTRADVRQSFKKKAQAIRCTSATRDDWCYWGYWLAPLMGVFRAIMIKMSGQPPHDCCFYKRCL